MKYSLILESQTTQNTDTMTKAQKTIRLEVKNIRIVMELLHQNRSKII